MFFLVHPASATPPSLPEVLREVRMQLKRSVCLLAGRGAREMYGRTGGRNCILGLMGRSRAGIHDAPSMSPKTRSRQADRCSSGGGGPPSAPEEHPRAWRPAGIAQPSRAGDRPVLRREIRNPPFEPCRSSDDDRHRRIHREIALT